MATLAEQIREQSKEGSKRQLMELKQQMPTVDDCLNNITFVKDCVSALKKNIMKKDALNHLLVLTNLEMLYELKKFNARMDGLTLKDESKEAEVETVEQDVQEISSEEKLANQKAKMAKAREAKALKDKK